MDDYVKLATRTEAPVSMELMGRLSEQARPVHAIFGMLTEVGELTDAFKRHIFYGKEVDHVNIAEEIGDVFWYIAILCDHCGVSFEQCMKANIAKLRARYPDKFNESDAVVRDLDKEQEILADSMRPGEATKRLLDDNFDKKFEAASEIKSNHPRSDY